MRNQAMTMLALLVVSWPLAAHSAKGAKHTSSLAWVRLEGAESCIATSALAQSVEAKLGRKVFVSPSDSDITIEGTIGRAPRSGFRAQLRVTAKDGTVLGTRDVETRSASCSAIDEKLALVLSVLIDPDAENAQEPGPSSAPPAPPVQPTVIERERIVVVPAPPQSTKESWRFELTLAAMGTYGLQPSVGGAFAPSILVTPPHFWGIRAGGGIAAETSIEARDRAKADASLVHGTLALCPLAIRSGRLEGLACAGALVGALRASGIGFDTSATTSSLVAGPLVLTRASFAIVGPLVASLALDLAVPIAQAEIAYSTTSGDSALFRSAPVAAMAELGVGVKFP